MINDIFFEEFPQLESERLIFRKFKEGDAVDIHLIRSNNQVMRYMDSPKHLTTTDSKKFIANNQEIYKKKDGIFWAIIEKETNELIGDFAYWKLNRKHNRGEIGYSLKPKFWGKGYMTETMMKLIDFGFRDLKLHSIEANINPGNETSKKVLLKAGFRKEAYFRENFFFEGRYLDSEIFSLLESDFKKDG